MNKDDFYAMEPHVRVGYINKMLQTRGLEEVAKEIGMSPSSFSREMQNGDFVFIKRENQYYKFVRNNNIAIGNGNSQVDETLNLINNNLDTIKRIISLFKDKTPLVLDEKVYSKQAKYTNNNIKMNDLIYKEFVNFCDERYPVYRRQDLVAQALLELMNKYSI
jgi:hypothetical protein